MDVQEFDIEIPETLKESILEFMKHNPSTLGSRAGWKRDYRVDRPPECIRTFHEQLKNFFKDYSIIRIWLNVNSPGDSCYPHIHSSQGKSAVVYVYVPENSGRIIFSQGTTFNPIVPKAGKVMVFPSDLRHLVEENKSNEYRISIAMDII